ncbi:dirigent protein 23-like [Prosopis cineraria]|uniref:dirigent protein 23-like n=1 Tax=Prosopis cineraria TaxID=364024 RepID=UPI00240EE458|nr:dirigent protein 23-like [Prosopis cineraria]
MSKQAFEITMLVFLMATSTNPLRAIAEPENKETVTNLHFYFHDIVSGKNPTAVRVVQPAEAYKSTTLFGVVMMADDPLAETPDPNSKLVGRAQGLYTSACQQELGLLMSMSFSFTDGSSVSILGKNSAMNPVREMPVVGGTGKFRLARGYALAQTHWFDPATGDAIVAYNVTVIHVH